MIEKKLIEILDPIIEQIVAVEKRVEGLQREPGPAGENGKDGRDGVSPSVDDIAAHIKSDGDFCERLRGVPGQPGKDGRDGSDADPVAVADVLKGDEAFVERLKGPQGEKGEKGDRGDNGDNGRDGADASPDDVAARLKADESFVSAIKGDQGERGEKGDPGIQGEPGRDGADADPDLVADALMRKDSFIGLVVKNVEEKPWVQGIYREGTLVSAYMGRSYQAVCDTTDVPGDSPHWKRIGSHGWRDVGGYDEKRAWEPGDLYHKDGSLFLFDGMNHRLAMAKPFTERDFEKATKSMRSSFTESLKALNERNKELEALTDFLMAEMTALKQAFEDLKVKK